MVARDVTLGLKARSLEDSVETPVCPKSQGRAEDLFTTKTRRHQEEWIYHKVTRPRRVLGARPPSRPERPRKAPSGPRRPEKPEAKPSSLRVPPGVSAGALFLVTP